MTVLQNLLKKTVLSWDDAQLVLNQKEAQCIADCELSKQKVQRQLTTNHALSVSVSD